MSETTWGADSEPAPKKKIPTWLWFCGGGCIGAIILAIVLGGWLFGRIKDYVRESQDPEIQWANLAKILPYDERPKELNLKWGSQIKIEMYVFDDKRGFADILMRFGAADSESVRTQMLNEKFTGKFLMFPGRENLQAGTIDVQGRELRVLRFDQMGGGGQWGSGGQPTKEGSAPPEMSQAPTPGKGPTALVDLTRSGEKRAMVLEMVRMHSTDPITDEEIRDFLKPFHVGDKR